MLAFFQKQGKNTLEIYCQQAHFFRFKLIDRLQRSAGQWVSLPTLVGYTGAYAVHSRVSDARKRGCTIEQRTEVAKDGVRHSFYRLLAP
jgi:hypothetical protein